MVGALTAKELKVLWTSPLPYLLAGVFHATLGFLGQAQLASRGQAVFQPLVPIAGFLLILVVPVLTARSFSEEIRTGSLELLLAIPVPNRRLVIGKYLALLVTLGAILAPIGAFVGLLFAYGDPDTGPVITGLIGLVLMGAALAAIGLLASSLTSSQPVAALGALFGVLALWFAHVGSDAHPAGTVASSLSLSERLRGPAGGVLDSSDVAFFASVIVLCLLAASAAVESRRWR